MSNKRKRIVLTMSDLPDELQYEILRHAAVQPIPSVFIAWTLRFMSNELMKLEDEFIYGDTEAE